MPGVQKNTSFPLWAWPWSKTITTIANMLNTREEARQELRLAVGLSI